ncbi:MAG: hypothetical protein H0U59_07550 [Gemmatimonadaceae bacterium]|nr:hypothetical protein [Gemmatimonadaceae bacterium]
MIRNVASPAFALALCVGGLQGYRAAKTNLRSPAQTPQTAAVNAENPSFWK